MKPELSVIIIGAGGVASYMLPALLKSFSVTGVMFDGDKLEKRNLDRQLFSQRDVGRYKSEALIRHLRANGLKAINTFFRDDAVDAYELRDLEADLIIVLVDNHPARKAALEAADELKVPCIIAANEYVTSQVLYYEPSERGRQMDPRVRYPELLTDISGDPTSCQGEAQEASPQLAIANQVSGALANLMIWLWHSEPLTHEIHKTLPIEYQTTYSGVAVTSVQDVLDGVTLAY